MIQYNLIHKLTNFLFRVEFLEQNFSTIESETHLRPIEYNSKTYTPAQKNYSTTEKELLAVVMAVEHFHKYAYGKKFIIY
jgi:hypothetical protein